MEESAINNTRMENVMVMEFLNNMMDYHIMDSTNMECEMVMGTCSMRITMNIMDNGIKTADLVMESSKRDQLEELKEEYMLLMK